MFVDSLYCIKLTELFLGAKAFLRTGLKHTYFSSMVLKMSCGEGRGGKACPTLLQYFIRLI
jgi:hypothetical protein